MTSPEKIPVSHEHNAGQENPADILMPQAEELVSAHSEAVQGVQSRDESGRFVAKDSHLPEGRLLAPEEKQAYKSAHETTARTLEAYNQAGPEKEVSLPDALQLPRDWSDSKAAHEQKQREHIEKIKLSLGSGLDAHEDHKTVLQEKRDTLKQERWDERRKELEEAAKLRYGSMRLKKEPGLAEDVERQVRTQVEGELGSRPLTKAEQIVQQEADQRQVKQENAKKEVAYRNSAVRQRAVEERAKTAEAAKEFQRGYANTGNEHKTAKENTGVVAGMYVEAAQVEKGKQETTTAINDIEKGLFGAVEGAGHKQLSEAIDSYYAETTKTPKDANEAKEQLKAAMANAGAAMMQAGKTGNISAAIARIEKINGKKYLIYAKTGNAKLAVEGDDSVIYELGASSSGDICSAIELKDSDRIMLATSGMKGSYSEQFKPDTAEASSDALADLFDKDGAVIVIDAFNDESEVKEAEAESEVEEPPTEALSLRERFARGLKNAADKFSAGVYNELAGNKKRKVVAGVLGVGALYLASKYGLDLINGGDNGVSSNLDPTMEGGGDDPSPATPQNDVVEQPSAGHEAPTTSPQHSFETLNVQYGGGFEDSFQNQYNLTDQEAADLYWNHIQPHMEGVPGTYEISPGNIGISESGTLSLPVDAQIELEEFLRSKGKI